MKCIWSLLASTTALLSSCAIAQVANPLVPDVTPIEYTDGNATLLGHLALPEDAKGPVPAIVIIP